MNTIPVIYVAGPYRGRSREAVELNIQAARSVGLLCCRKGWSPIIPHANTSHMDAMDPDIGDAFWLASTMELLRRCDAVVLVPGWDRSSGTKAEIDEAMRLNLQIFTSENMLPLAAKFVQSNDNNPATASLTAG